MIFTRAIRPALLVLLLLAVSMSSPVAAAEPFPLDAKRILFIGDSITHAGEYVAWIETQLLLVGTDPMPEIIGIGLSSETCTGLSEPDHPFPRPDVHERLDRALAKLKPDVVVACYGMNDGIYYPFSEDRFQAYQAGINKIISKVHATGAKLILLTPPPFDPEPLRGTDKIKPLGEEKYAYFAMYEGYDDVLKRYGKWIMAQKDRVEMVIDVHTPLAEYTTLQRKTDPKFTLVPDGVHPNSIGQRQMGDAILHAWGIKKNVPPDPELWKLVLQKTHVLHDAWLSEVGHKRPGVKAGLPIPEAEARVKDLNAAITQKLVKAE